ncbi:MAG: helix-turn-helix transcriptional regulator [Atopobiaceae bacterium]|nr:helix-turn-helix transcriptional regulator [Atopobiaceae bacterium]
MTYGEVVSYYLDLQGVTQSELARRIGTGRQTINSIIKGGRRGPTLDTALAIADALNVPLQAMVDKMKEDGEE